MEEPYETVIKSRQTITECKIPGDCVRSIIGPQGSIIKGVSLIIKF